MDDTTFEPRIDDSYFSSSYEGVSASPDNSRVAGVFTDEDGEWIYVGSFENGMYRIQADLKPSFEYNSIAWISESEILYAHYSGLFAIVNVDTGEEQVFGERDGDIIPLGEIDDVLIGVRDTISGEHRFEVVGYVQETDEEIIITELEMSSLYFDVPVFLEGSSIYLSDYTVDADSLEDHGVYKYTVSRDGSEVEIEEEFKSIWDDASATPYGVVNEFLIVKKGGLEEEQRFSSDDLEREILLYDWDTGEIIEPSWTGSYSKTLSGDQVLSTELSDDRRSHTCIISCVEDDGSIEEEFIVDTNTGYRWAWALIDNVLYGYSTNHTTVVSYYNGDEFTVLDLDDADIIDSVDVGETIFLDDFYTGYSAEVYIPKNEELDDIEDRPVVICTYPSADITIRDNFGLELVERGFLVVNPIYDDGEYYGKTMALSELIKELNKRDYCGNIGLYGFSAGGTQVLNFASSTYSDMVEGVFAGCPDMDLGTDGTGHSAYMKPVTYEKECPMLFKDYSPLYKLDQIGVRTEIMEGKIDARINTVSQEEIREKVDDSLVSLTRYDIGHGAVRYEDQIMVLENIVEFFNKCLKE
jgi:hypothetical protein